MRRRQERDGDPWWPGACLMLSQRHGSDLRSDETLGTPNPRTAGRGVRMGER